MKHCICHLLLLLGFLFSTDAVRCEPSFVKRKFGVATATKHFEKTDLHPRLDLKQPTSTALSLRGGFISTETSVQSFLNGVDLFGTGVFAFAGAVQAGKNGMDILGMIIVATITAVGGGTVRDLLLDSGTVFWMKQTVYFEICLVVTILTFLFWPSMEKKMGWQDSAKSICTADAFGLGAFAVLGTQKGADFGLSPIMWVVVGVISSTFGGITRDILCLQVSRRVNQKNDIRA